MGIPTTNLRLSHSNTRTIPFVKHHGIELEKSLQSILSKDHKQTNVIMNIHYIAILGALLMAANQIEAAKLKNLKIAPKKASEPTSCKGLECPPFNKTGQGEVSYLRYPILFLYIKIRCLVVMRPHK